MPLLGFRPVNRLLAALPVKSRARDKCELVRLSIGDVLSEPGDRIRSVLFPAGGLISLAAVVDGGASIEVALIGRTGMLGAPLVLNAVNASSRAHVQVAGAAWRLGVADFHRALVDHPPLRRGLNRYLRGLIAELSQNSACSRFHLIEARLARRLLMAQDQSPDGNIHMTHGTLAKILGVRRSGVTTAAVRLQKRGLIEYSRGGIVILDRSGLQRAACACSGSDSAATASGALPTQ